MGLSAEEKKTLDALTKKSKEPDAPAPSVNYNLDLSSDTAWNRAKEIGLIPGGEEESEEEEEEADPTPKRRGYFGGDD